MTPKTLIALMFAVSAWPFSAHTHADDQPVFTQPAHRVAMSREEQRAMRERWEQATPEERVRMRRFFQERLRQDAPESSAMHKPRQGKGGREYGFGMGFEARQAGDESAPPSSPEHRGGPHRPSFDR